MLRRLPLAGQLLLPALAAILMAVAAVQAWGLRGAIADAEATQARKLEMSMTALEELLRPLGEGWRREGEQLFLGATPLADRNDVVDAVGRMGAVATIFAGDRRVATSVRRPDGTRGTGTTLAAGPAYDAAVTRGETYRGRNTILGRDYLTVYQPVRDAQGRQAGMLFVGVPAADTAALVRGKAIQAAVVSGLALVLIGAFYTLWLRAAFRPLEQLAGAVDAVAAGRADVAVPATERKDALGRLARAVEGWRDSAAKLRRAEGEAEAERRRAEAARGEAARALAEEVERKLGAVVQGLAASSRQLSDAAEGLGATASAAEGDATAAAGAAGETSATIQTVAAAAEELAASVAEIARQAAQSGEVAARAAEEVAATDGAVQRLSASAARIGDVVRLISDIAGQTNLLALNATIEAARAGEAGKGFAVVASEVKSLASQTAKATEEIGGQIAGMREAVDASVSAIRGIGAVVQEVSQLAAAIAAGVQEQGAATREIASNVAQAAQGASGMSERAARLSEATGETSGAVAQLRGLSADMAAQGEAVRREVAGFAERLREAA